MRRGLLAAILGFAILGSAPAARAALIHNFIDTSDNSVLGSITFSAETPGTVTAFSFSGFGSPALGLADLCLTAADCDLIPLVFDTTWSIDSNWELDAFDLMLDLGDAFGPGSDYEVIIDFLMPASNGVTGISSFFNGAPDLSAVTFFEIETFQNLATVAVEVPEPATMTFFAVGLAGLALARRRRSA